MEQQTGVIIVAGGSSNRMGGALPKQFMLLGREPVLVRTINNFAEALPGAPIVVVLPAAYIDFWHNLAARFEVAPHKVVEGGRERFHSVRDALGALPSEVQLIAVQDGVRPLATHTLIRCTIATAAEHGVAVPVVEPVDSFREMEAGTVGTIRTAGTEQTSCDTDAASAICAAGSTGAESASGPLAGNARSHPIDRRRLRVVQTPQVFRADILREAYKADYRDTFTDDASVVEHAGHAIRLCKGERTNLKITMPEDLVIARAVIEDRRETEADGAGTTADNPAISGSGQRISEHNPENPIRPDGKEL